MSTAVAIAPPTAKPAIEACWTVDDLATYLRAGRSTILLWIKQGKLPSPKRVGRQLLWEPDVVRAFVASRGA